MRRRPRRPLGKTRRKAATVRALLVVGLVLVAAGVLDMSRRPENQYAARVADALIGAYQVALSPFLVRMGVRCRFVPSCSEYARAQIRARGLAAGGVRSAARLARCGPWTPFGTVDPPVAAVVPSVRPMTDARTGTLVARGRATRVLAPGEDPAVKRRPH